MFSTKEKYTEFHLWHFVLLGIIAVIAIFLLLWSKKLSVVQLGMGNNNFSMLLADTPERWNKGLSGRKSLENYDGMLFVFPDYETRPLVMRDMNFPLDVIWLNGDEVVDIRSNLAPESKPEAQLTQYLPQSSANAVIEVPAGFIEKNQVKVGDKVRVIK